MGQISRYHTVSMNRHGAGEGCSAWRPAFLWGPASEQLPTVPATEPNSSVKMLFDPAAAQGSGNKADVWEPLVSPVTAKVGNIVEKPEQVYFLQVKKPPTISQSFL